MQIEWKKRAICQLEKAVNYGYVTFGQRAAVDFYKQVKDNDFRLATNPYLGLVDELFAGRKVAYRSLVVHKHYKLLYRIDEEKEVLYICALLDIRRGPDRLKKQV